MSAEVGLQEWDDVWASGLGTGATSLSFIVWIPAVAVTARSLHMLMLPSGMARRGTQVLVACTTSLLVV